VSDDIPWVKSPRVPHPSHKEGSRRHVVSYWGWWENGMWTSRTKCSEPRCEMNSAALATLPAEREVEA
jgi:hypothetical protein